MGLADNDEVSMWNFVSLSFAILDSFKKIMDPFIIALLKNVFIVYLLAIIFLTKGSLKKASNEKLVWIVSRKMSF